MLGSRKQTKSLTEPTDRQALAPRLDEKTVEIGADHSADVELNPPSSRIAGAGNAFGFFCPLILLRNRPRANDGPLSGQPVARSNRRPMSRFNRHANGSDPGRSRLRLHWRQSEFRSGLRRQVLNLR
jgi:hypothetical protein